MDVFLTGGSGFLGQHLLHALTTEGHRVRAAARSGPAADIVTAAGADPVRGSLTDVAAMAEGMRGCDVVIHAAAHTKQWDEPRLFDEVNVSGTSAIIQAARTSQVARLVHISTEAVLADGRPLIRVDETYPIPERLVGAYARTKATAERAVLAADSAKLATVVVRPRLIWGPGDTSVLPAIIEAARSGRFAWIDHGQYLTSTCHVYNACHGISQALERGHGGQVYFLTDGAPINFRQFLTALAATRGVKLGNRSIPRPIAWTAATVLEQAWRVLRIRTDPPISRTFLALSAQEMTVDDTKARRELGYDTVISREAGLADLARSEVD
jgi:nucleoside-diphosphate-sugar epimerase